MNIIWHERFVNIPEKLKNTIFKCQTNYVPNKYSQEKNYKSAIIGTSS